MLAFLTSFIFAVQTFAQVSTYTLTPIAGTFTPLTSPTSSSLANAADDGISSNISIGFPFNYNGTSYTNVRVASNGYMTFGTAGTGGINSINNNLATATTTFRQSVAALWDDIRPTVGVTYKTEGTAPNRTFTAQWLNMRWDATATAAQYAISFQVKIYETTNIIDVIYRQEAGAIVNTSGGASIGLMGSLATDFISLQNSSAAPATSTSASTNNIAAKPATG